MAEADLPFLRAVYASTRADELAQVDWTDAQRAAFVAMQFDAQHRHYQAHYTDTDFLVILCDGEPCGRLYLARWPGEFRLVELTLLPGFRNRGLGSRLLAGMLSEADAAQKPVTIHVEHQNPARHLYQRLGFAPVSDHGVHLLMKRPCPGRPDAPQPTPASEPCTTA